MRNQIYLLYYALFTLFCRGDCSFFPYVYPRIEFEAGKPDESPLFLTPYLKKGSITEAQNLSRVNITEAIGFESHAGFFTVDEKFQSNLYFWYFPAFSKKKDAPVVLWLQGGPGGSSLFGLFTEIGPLIAKAEGFALRKYHWAINYHLIFIDNPVGTGFSFTKHKNGYCNDEDCIAKNLYSCMYQFYLLFPDLINNDLYLTGESYAGKYLPSLAMEIHKQNQVFANKKLNLKGLAMGNAYCDPVHQLDYSTYLYQHGLLDDNQRNTFESIQNEIMAAIEGQDWVLADLLMDQLLDGEISKTSFFRNFTGFEYYYNFLQTNDTLNTTIFTDLLNNEKVRRAIHVGGLPFNSGEEVQLHLAEDILKSVAPTVAELLSHYRILLYNGQLDIIVAYPLTEKFLRNLQFSSAAEYKTAHRNIWRVGSEIAGYYKKAGNLTEVLVRNAGHMVPTDQPKWALDLINRFIRNKI